MLISEDESSVRRFINIAWPPGYTILESEHGHTAIQLSETQPCPIHLLLAILAMPGIKWMQLTERLLLPRPSLKALCPSGMPEEDVFPDGLLPPNSAFLQNAVHGPMPSSR